MILKLVKRQTKRIEGSLGRVIAVRRGLAGWTQEEFAEKAGVGISTLKDIERGVSGGSPKIKSAIAKALHCSVDDLSKDPEGKDVEARKIIQDLMQTISENPIPPAVWFAWNSADEWQRAIAMFFLTGKDFHLDKGVPEEFRRRLLDGLRFHKMMPRKARSSKR